MSGARVVCSVLVVGGVVVSGLTWYSGGSGLQVGCKLVECGGGEWCGGK